LEGKGDRLLFMEYSGGFHVAAGVFRLTYRLTENRPPVAQIRH